MLYIRDEDVRCMGGEAAETSHEICGTCLRGIRGVMSGYED